MKLLYHEAMLDHADAWNTPEVPERLEAVVEEMQRARLAGAEWVRPDPVDSADLLRVHDPDYVRMLDEVAGRSVRLAVDTATSPGSTRAARIAAGAAVAAVDSVYRDDDPRAFALVRPPGHHAGARRAMGFCLVNNVAVAAAHARAVHGARRVLVVDWDVHHGNGTQHLFESSADVLFFSTHRYPFYPGTGALDEVGKGAGAGFTVNVPMQWGLRDRDFGAVFEQVLRPIADAYEPEVVLVSAGFDAHADDPLGDQRVTEDGFAALCGTVRDLADAHAGGRLVLLMEGGYDLGGLARSARACAEVLCGAEPPPVAQAGVEGRALVRAVRESHAPFWPVLGGE